MKCDHCGRDERADDEGDLQSYDGGFECRNGDRCADRMEAAIRDGSALREQIATLRAQLKAANERAEKAEAQFVHAHDVAERTRERAEAAESALSEFRERLIAELRAEEERGGLTEEQSECAIKVIRALPLTTGDGKP